MYKLINQTRDCGNSVVSTHKTRELAIRELYKNIEIMKGYYKSYGWVFDSYHFISDGVTTQKFYITNRNGNQVKINESEKR